MKTVKKVRLADVAARAGVSCGAAGKVLNGGSNSIRVGEAARQRILEAADALGYSQNMAASILAGGKSKLIGVIIDSASSYRYQRLLYEIERVAASLGYRILTSFTHDNIATLRDNYRTMQGYGMAGFICCAHDYPDLKDEMREFIDQSENVVFMEKPIGQNVPYVATDRTNALSAMIADALSKGYKRIGLRHGSLIWQTEQALYDEFQRAMALNGLDFANALVIEDPPGNLPLAERVTWFIENYILREHPDFLYVDDAYYAAVLQHQLHECGLNITLCGGDANPLFHGLGINSFDPCYEKIARALVELLVQEKRDTEPVVIEAVYRNGTVKE